MLDPAIWRNAPLWSKRSGLTSDSEDWTSPERVLPQQLRPVALGGDQGLVAHASSEGAAFMIILGVVLLIIGFFASIPILWTIGIILVVVGAVLALVGRSGRKVGGRAHWY